MCVYDETWTSCFYTEVNMFNYSTYGTIYSGDTPRTTLTFSFWQLRRHETSQHHHEYAERAQDARLQHHLSRILAHFSLEHSAEFESERQYDILFIRSPI